MQTHYKTQPSIIPIAFLEPELIAEDIATITQKIFPPNFHFVPENLKKTKEFYEFILVDTDSVKITHTPINNNALRIAFSKLKIMKELSMTDWNQSLYTEKTFSQPYFPSSYSYIDYQKAWFNVLFLQPYNHSWFLHFGSSI